MVRVTRVQSQVASYQRLKRWYLIPPCLTLSNIRYVSRVKWSNSVKGVAPYPTPRCSYWKGSLWSPSTTVANYYIYIYIYLKMNWPSKWFIQISSWTYSFKIFLSLFGPTTKNFYTHTHTHIYMCVCVYIHLLNVNIKMLKD